MPQTPLSRRNALFLDLDGTVIDIAATPDAVRRPACLSESLHALRAGLGGAVAIVSGRPLAQIDALLAEPGLPAAAEHGAVIRRPDGAIEEAQAGLPQQAAWADALRAAAGAWPGAMIEEKAHSLVAHYRLAPAHGPALRRFIEVMIGDGAGHVEILPARMAFEIRARGIGKGHAVRHLMTLPPFAGRVPVFVGDDVTDEEGMQAAEELGGIGLHVARAFGGRPAAVRRWLARSADALNEEARRG
ncbi:MAG TPA: trehalose-phosphatase [Acetobacteraceae bacterium]|nr:trehalose-phosphatase [Acetobacteraceae bacterium]